MGLQTGNLACQSLKPDKNQIIAFTFYYQNLPPSLYDSVHHHMGHIHTLARGSWPEEGGYYDGKGDDDFKNNGADYDDDDNSRVIAVRTSSNRLGETDPSWLELFLELVLLGDDKSRSNVHLSVHQSPRTGSFQMPTPLPLLQLGLQLLPGILPHLLEGKENISHLELTHFLPHERKFRSGLDCVAAPADNCVVKASLSSTSKSLPLVISVTIFLLLQVGAAWSGGALQVQDWRLRVLVTSLLVNYVCVLLGTCLLLFHHCIFKKNCSSFYFTIFDYAGPRDFSKQCLNTQIFINAKFDRRNVQKS